MADIGPESWKCGYCDAHVSSKTGFWTESGSASARPCPRCKGISMFANGTVFPHSIPGEPVAGVDQVVADLYDEARRAAGAGAYTAAVMVCRKLLMNIAVTEHAKEGESFKFYVDYLEKQGLVSPKAKSFVEYLKDLGNEANHQIKPMDEEDARAAIDFVGSLLRHNYETPSRLPAKHVARGQTTP